MVYRRKNMLLVLIYGLYCCFFDASPGYHLDDWTTLLANLLLGILTISAAFQNIIRKSFTWE